MLTYLLCLFSEASCGAAEVEFVPRLWAPNRSLPPALVDIASRLPPYTPAKDSDLITYSHEGSHFLSRGKDGFHGLYTGNGIRLFVPTPPILTAEVFAAVPESERGDIYETYRKQGESEYWVAQPLMLCDEWIAYTHGSITRQQMGIAARQETDRHCATMANYVWHLRRLAQAKRDYPIKDLNEFCRWNEERCRVFIPDWEKLFTKKFD